MEKLSDKNRHQEIDLAELLRTLWSRRLFILLVTGVALVAGLLFALLGQVRYTAGSVVVPQTDELSAAGGIQGLAALAGINVPQGQRDELLSPLIYPMVVRSVPFQKELMRTPVTVDGQSAQVTLLDYFAKPTGLPRPPDVAPPEGVEGLTRDEYRCMTELSRRITVEVDEKNGYISLSASMPGPIMAAQVAARAQKMLEEYVTRFKLQRARSDLDFIEARYIEVRADFEASQRALAAFRDANRNIISEVAAIRENSLENEYDLAFSIYSELSRQLEQARIKVKEDTPVFTVIEPVTVPLRRSAPKRKMIMAVSLVLGLAVGAGVVFVKNYSTITRP